MHQKILKNILLYILSSNFNCHISPFDGSSLLDNQLATPLGGSVLPASGLFYEVMRREVQKFLVQPFNQHINIADMIIKFY